MQLPIRSLVLGSLIALGASAAHAQSTLPDATVAAAQPLQPLDLRLPATVAHPSGPLDLALPAKPVAPALSPPAELATASAELQRVLRWVADTHDNAGLPYLLVDKVNARVYAFSAAGQLQQSAPVLLGMTHGDQLKVSNETQMASMTEQDRVTPAGRFVSRLAIDSHGNELLVIDYDAAISLHPVLKGTPQEHRAERLASATPQDNRISFGCINVPPEFYSKIVSPAFTHTKGIVYILPESSPAAQLFGFQPAGDGAVAADPITSTALHAAAAPAAQTVKASEAR